MLPIWISPQARIANLSYVSTDPYGAVWFLTWTPFAITHGHTAFVTDYVNYPMGTNMMWQTWMPALAILLWPVTALGGAVLTDNLITTLGFALSAFFAFLAIRRYVRSDLAAALGGLLYGFSPYMVAQGQVHAQMVSAAMAIPLFLIGVDETLIRQRMRPWLLGILTAAALVFEFFVLEEYFLMEVFAAVLLAGILAVCYPRQVRARIGYALKVAGVALVVVVAAIAYPVIAVQLLGPDRVFEQLHDPNTYVTDLLNLIVPTSTQLLAPSVATDLSHAFTGNISELDGYLGVGLVLVFLIAAVAWWRKPVIRVSALFAVLTTLLSLGPHLHVGGHQLSFPLPYSAVVQVPLIRDIQANRLMVFVFLALAVLVGVVLSVLWRERRRPLLALIVTAMVFVPLIPHVPISWQPYPQPTFFSAAALEEIPRDSVVLTVPCLCPYANSVLAAQSSTNFRFKLIGGYLPGPLSPGQDTLRNVARMLAGEHPVAALDDTQRTSLLQELQDSHVTVIAMGPVPNQAQSAALLSDVLGIAPMVRGNTDLWFLS